MHDLVIRDGLIVDGTGGSRFAGDVAIESGRIAQVGGKAGAGRREIRADGQLVTPGVVAAHTHYDGQVTWDPTLYPSSAHGVTTAVMGNCGVGFAPARTSESEREFMIRMMEGVEEIPGSALVEGMRWEWETFPEYLDLLDRIPHAVNVVTQVPHAAVRAYVMGEERAHDQDCNADELQQMVDITREALRAGALGFTTSREVLIHRSTQALGESASGFAARGPQIPGSFVPVDELFALTQTLGDVGHGVFEIITSEVGYGEDFDWMTRIARNTRRPVAFIFAQLAGQPEEYKAVLQKLSDLRAEGLDMRGLISAHPTGVNLGLQSSINPFSLCPSFQDMHSLPLADKVARMRDPDLRARLLAEGPTVEAPPDIAKMTQHWRRHFVLGDPPNYEPTREQSIAARAAAAGVDPKELAYDTLLEREGQQLIYVPIANYADYDLEATREMLEHPQCVISLSDGGAHVKTICDACQPTFLLTHWVRDRTRGPRLSLEHAVQLQTRDTAELYGLHDRGVLEVGKRADVNVIDFDALELHAPRLFADLPNGGERLIQTAKGYTATLVAGEAIVEHDKPTGACPGSLVRGPQPA